MTHWHSNLRPSHFSVRSLAVLLICAACTGCELDRPSMQMNSNSPTPFFGIDLLPRRKTTSIVTPQAGQQLASVESVGEAGDTVDEAPSRRRFWQRNVKSVDPAPTTIILPLSRPGEDQIMDRGPVELLR